MAGDRGLLTDREREILTESADVSDNYRYRTISRIRNKIERIERDTEILADTRPDLLEDLRNAVCEEEESASQQ